MKNFYSGIRKKKNENYDDAFMTKKWDKYMNESEMVSH